MKAKNYLNKDEAMILMCLAVTAEYVGTAAKNWRDETEKDYLAKANDHLWKAIDSIMAKQSEESKAGIFRRADLHEIKVLPKDKYMFVTGKPKTELDDIYKLAEYALAGWCTKCTFPQSECDLRALLKRLGVPVNEDSKECEYRGL